MNFRHHRDGWIFIGDDQYPIAWFLIQEPEYSLPAEAISREYSADRHVLYSSDSQWGGEIPWEDGDRYLANQDAYRATWQAEHLLPEEPEEPEPETQAEWDQFRVQILAHPAYFRIAGHSSQTQVLNSSLVWLIGEIGENPGILPKVIDVWNGIAHEAQPTEAEIASLNQIAANTNMLFRLNESGCMVPASS